MRWTSFAAALAGLSLLAAGCGGAKSPSVASVGTAASLHSAGGSTSAAPGTNPQLAFARCMRSDGVPAFPDPSPDGGFLIKIGPGIDPSSPAFKAARAKCQKLMPGGGPLDLGSTTHPTARWLAHMISVAHCMRRHGVPSFPDPTTTVPSMPLAGGGGVVSDIDGVVFAFSQTIDTQSPAFVRAAAVCGFPLHNH